jgi:glycosyltransferase involved in cell wall biosynthesis
VTLLVTHYNRSASLERELKSFADLGMRFGEVVVSDDSSKEEHFRYLTQLQQQYAFRLVTTPKNQGLGHNINKGQEAVTTPYTLYVQEDFVPKPAFKKAFADALQIMESQPGIDIIRFYAYFNYPYTMPFGNGFSEMIFHPAPWYANHLKFYLYSDHPHLRRSNFLQKFGRYPEGIKGDATEYKMMMSVLQKGGQGIFYEDFKGLFDQKNSADEPSTMKRDSLRNSENVAITAVRNLYRHLKFNFDYHFRK